MKRILFTSIAALFFFLSLSLSALTIEQGRLRLVLHEDNGRFSLYYLDDIEKERYVSLLFERDPRTSSTGLMLNNRIVTLGSSNMFQQKVERTVDGARFIWTSPSIEVEQRFRFVKSNPNGLADGMAITSTIRNKSEEIQEIGLSLLFDTYLGEDEDAHFVTSENEKLTGETGYSLQIPLYWLSPAQDKNFKGFQSVLKGKNVSIPDKVVFSNWKRLSESLWNIQVQSNRNFNLLPYSINDSAVAQFYDPLKLASGAERTITALIGAYTSQALTLDDGSSASEESDSLDQTLVVGGETSEEDIRSLIRQDLIAVNDLIANIDSLLSFPDEINQDKIDVIKKALQNLDEKKSQYNSGK